MNSYAEGIVVDLIALHGGKLVGRTRLQKRAYLLHRCGAEFDVKFVYHYYGPYSFDLADGWVDARINDKIEMEEKEGRYGVPYSIFKIKKKVKGSGYCGALSFAEARPFLKKIERVSDIVLEIAATIVFLRDDGGYPNTAVAETKARKPVKTGGGSLEAALSLIRELGLDRRNALRIPG